MNGWTCSTCGEFSGSSLFTVRGWGLGEVVGDRAGGAGVGGEGGGEGGRGGGGHSRDQTPSTGLRHPSFNHCRI